MPAAAAAIHQIQHLLGKCVGRIGRCHELAEQIEQAADAVFFKFLDGPDNVAALAAGHEALRQTPAA